MITHRRRVAFRLLTLAFALLVIFVLLGGTAQAAWPPAIPAQAVLEVRNASTADRIDEIARGGIPIPRARNLLNIAGLAIVDNGGTPVPATFRVLARWNAGRNDTTAPIQWLLVRFPATVPAGQSRSFTLRMDGSVVNPAPAVALQLVQEGQRVTVDTGAARFVFGGAAAQVFERIERNGGVALATGSTSSVTTGGATASGFTVPRRVMVEHADALSATVIVEGETGFAPVGEGAISAGRRLEFTAGSPAVSVREWVDWEGVTCAMGTPFDACAGTSFGRLIERWRLSLTPALTGPRTVVAQSDLSVAAGSAALAAGATASLRQLRRADRLQAQRFELALPGQAAQNGVRAEHGALLLSGNEGRVGIALKSMADYEPQALRVLADGSLVADLADDGFWLALKQGAFAEYRLGAFAPGVSNADALRQLSAPLRQPLLAIAAPAWIAASRATDEFPVGALPPAIASFDALLQDLIDRTRAERRAHGLEGLMTFGSFPRNWGHPVFQDEIAVSADPTPADDWDDVFWGTFWTDYHNTTTSALIAAWRFGDPRPIHDISTPAALRQLHTQMIRCAPDDDYFYCGDFPSGYGAFRLDFNSSHAYTENLIQYYWMTGDITVVERMTRGLRARRGYQCPARGTDPPGPVCGATQPISDDFAGLNDRTATQGYQGYRFAGLAGDDASYLDDWRSNTARFLTQNFALLDRNGQVLGLTEPSGAGTQSIINGPGSYFSTQLWMASIYDFNTLYRLEVDSGDALLGTPAIAPSEARHAWGRTLVAASQLVGDGTAAGTWPNALRFSFTGARVGGSLSTLEADWAPGPMPQPCLDSCLYDFGKATLTATLMRSADDLGDATVRAAAIDLVQHTLQAMDGFRTPMGKSAGELFPRLTSAVARLAAAGPDGAIHIDGFE